MSSETKKLLEQFALKNKKRIIDADNLAESKLRQAKARLAQAKTDVTILSLAKERTGRMRLVLADLLLVESEAKLAHSCPACGPEGKCSFHEVPF